MNGAPLHNGFFALLQRCILATSAACLLASAGPLAAAPPVITSFSPASARAGASVSLNGTDLTTATQVRFNGIEATFRIFGSLVSATVPMNATTGPITLVTPEGTATSPTDFVVLPTPPPGITAFNPASGAVGTRVTITGTNLAGSVVRFAGVSASDVVAIDSEISATVPTGATTGRITVTTAGGTATSAADFVVQAAPAPVVQGFSPTSGSAGAFVTITGLNFNSVSQVAFNGVPAASFSVFGGQISARVPAGAGSGPISVTAAGGTGVSTASFTVISDAPPVISSFAPDRGAPETVVVIRGTGFTGVTRVLFNGLAAVFQVPSSSEISALVPEGATTGPITVATSTGTNVTSASFTVTGPGPVITDFAPGGGAAGTTVVIAGIRFSQVSGVEFGGVAAQFNVVSTNQILATAPPNVPTGLISVIAANGIATSPRPFYGPPAITSFAPTAARVNAAVVIQGSNLEGATSVKVGDQEMVFTILSRTEIRATMPETAAGGILSVTTPGGTAASAAALELAPSIRVLDPAAGQPGAVIAIRGSGLSGATAVAFNGVAATAVTNISAEEIHAVVPDDATTGPVTVQTAAGQAASAESFQVALEIRGFEPAAGFAGRTLIIRGASFLGATAVEFGGLRAEFTVESASRIRAVVPLEARTGPVSVATPAGTSFSRDPFVVQPHLISFAPQAGRPGDAVLIHGSGFLGVTDVAIGLARASFQVESATRIRIVVPDTVTSAQILLTSPSGVTTSTNRFIAGDAADLRLQAVANPASPAPGSNISLTLIVNNLGPNAATNVVVTNQLPAGAAFVSSIPPVTPDAGGTLVLPLGNLASGASTFASVTLKINAAGVYTNRAAVASTLPDPDAINSQAATVLNVEDQTPPLLAIQTTQAGGVQISWPAASSSFRLQSRSSLSAGAWADDPAQVTVQGENSVVTQPAAGDSKFFRLIR